MAAWIKHPYYHCIALPFLAGPWKHLLSFSRIGLEFYIRLDLKGKAHWRKKKSTRKKCHPFYCGRTQARTLIPDSCIWFLSHMFKRNHLNFTSTCLSFYHQAFCSQTAQLEFGKIIYICIRKCRGKTNGFNRVVWGLGYYIIIYASPWPRVNEKFHWLSYLVTLTSITHQIDD